MVYISVHLPEVSVRHRDHDHVGPDIGGSLCVTRRARLRRVPERYAGHAHYASQTRMWRTPQVR